MRCPECNHKANDVIDSRKVDVTNSIRRRRRCRNKNCRHRWTTTEINIYMTKRHIKREVQEEYRKQVVAMIEEPLKQAITRALRGIV